jgi:GYD domain
VQSMGVRINQMYWTLGQYVQVYIFDAPNDETATSVLLAADMLGNIRTRTMRAFTTSEMERILSKMPLPADMQEAAAVGTQACCSKGECAALANRVRGDAVSRHQSG